MGVGLVARVVVGLVLLASGALKLRDPAWPATAAAFGTPAPVVGALPWAELVLGALLIVQLGGPWPPLAAVGLLLGFTAAVVFRLARGQRIPCGCFGQVSSAPVGPATVVRNLVLCGVALVGVLAR